MLNTELLILGNLTKDLHNQGRNVVVVSGSRLEEPDNYFISETGEKLFREGGLHIEVEDVAE